MGERIRQFHFQMFAFRLPQILKSLRNDTAKSAFLLERSLWLESFKAHFVGKLDSVFAALIEEDEIIDLWLHDEAVTDEAAGPRDVTELKPLFEAYRELRILHQIDYATYKLQDDHKLISAVPRTQLTILSQMNFTWIVLLCVMHIGIVLGAIRPHSVWAVFHSPEAIVAIIWLALAALATRAIEQGLQPEREIERYQQYRSGLRAILERYDAAPSQAESGLGDLARAPIMLLICCHRMFASRLKNGLASAACCQKFVLGYRRHLTATLNRSRAAGLSILHLHHACPGPHCRRRQTQRMPAIMDHDILPDMGRMTARLLSGGSHDCSRAPIAAGSAPRSC
jgi:hypothetical protein